MRGRAEQGVLVLLTVSAVAMAAAMVKREFFTSPSARIVSPDAVAPTLVKQWRDVLKVGAELGEPRAPVKLVEFSDLECPFCKRFHESVLPAVQEEFGTRVSLVFVHFPLPNHRFSEPAARAAECAAAEGAFSRYIEAVFAKQDSLGLRSWTAYALDAAVPDTVRFNQCVRSPDAHARITAGKETALRLGVRGTPGIMVNGWLFPSPPGDSALRSVIRRVLADVERHGSS